jgi:hypothetical protein
VHGSFAKVKKYLKGMRLNEMDADDGWECLTIVMIVGYGKVYRGDTLEQARSLYVDALCRERRHHNHAGLQATNK